MEKKGHRWENLILPSVSLFFVFPLNAVWIPGVDQTDQSVYKKAIVTFKLGVK